MSIADFITKHRTRYREEGATAIPPALKDLGVSLVSRAPYVSKYGMNVFEREWDVLVILDGCRFDMYQEVVGATDSIWSKGSSSPEWMKHNFLSPDYLDERRRTAIVSSNPFTGRTDREGHVFLDKSEFGLVDEVWTYGWNEDLGTTTPDIVTDRAVDVVRLGNYDRVIVHYMQPHYPFIGGDTAIGRIDVRSSGYEQGTETENVWADIYHGRREDVAQVVDAYYENLRYVFAHVETLMENVDGKVTVSADHGNLLGEYGLWGHRTGLVVPELRRVPWDTYECTDSGTYTPEVTRSRDGVDDETLTERLECLGYL